MAPKTAHTLPYIACVQAEISFALCRSYSRADYGLMRSVHVDSGDSARVLHY